MSLDLLEHLIGLVERYGLAELEYVADGQRVLLVANGATVMAARPAPGVPPAEPPLPSDDAAAATVAKARWVTAPVTGTFFQSSSPGAPPFVEIGARIEAGTVIGVIEAMKVMNAVASDFAGRVREIHVGDGSSVTADDLLVTIEPEGDDV